MGIGGLGFLAVQIAVHFGATVYALDMRPSSRVLAKVAGAKQAFSNEELDAEFQKGFTVDTTIDFIGSSFCECGHIVPGKLMIDKWLGD